MANYHAHVVTGVVSGLAGALATATVVGWVWWPYSTSRLALVGLSLLAGLVGGMVPDLDHDSGTPLREIRSLLSTLLPAMVMASMSGRDQGIGLGGVVLLVPLHCVLHRLFRGMPGLGAAGGGGAVFRQLAVSSIAVLPWFVWSGGRSWLPWRFWGVVLAIVVAVYGVVALFKRITVHRGLFHSLPGVALYGELVFLLLGYATDLPWSARWVVAGGGWAGGFSHLLLDELTAVDFEGRRLRNRRSLGTALNLWASNASGWSLLLYVAVAVGGLAMAASR
jgi:membrane-bound metal-dependent hydrolase YbcI (DUF457 family)